MATTARKQRLYRQETLNASPDSLPLVVLTSGEPAGIGPDICALLARENLPARLAVLGDPETLTTRSRLLDIALDIVLLDSLANTAPQRAGRLQILPVAAAVPPVPGRLNPQNSRSVVAMLELATRACVAGEADAIVTAPVQKSVIVEAGIPFSGHTELLGELTGAPRAVMLLASARLRVALATTHLPLAAVPAALTRDNLAETLRVVDHDLRRRFGIAQPRILVLGLNPHAGENGVLGTEERTTIEPVVAALETEGIRVAGPVPADSAFTPASLAEADVIVAMYHDQGLPVLKAMDFGAIVNITLGLPIVRTSVDHGTALALAGSGKAHHASLRRAVEVAVELTRASQ